MNEEQTDKSGKLNELSKLTVGTPFKDTFRVKRVLSKTTKTNRPYLLMIISDGVEECFCSIWSNNQCFEAVSQLQPNDEVVVGGTVDMWNGKLSPKVMTVE